MARDLKVPLDVAPASAAKARHALSALLLECGIEGADNDSAVLVASELVTNAVCHGGDPIELRADVSERTVRLEVRDGATELHDRKGTDSWSTTGRGLAIVEAMSRDWGVEWHGDAGKTVWADLDAPT